MAEHEPLPRLADSIVEAIGRTSMIDLRRYVAARGLDGRILLKLEYLNPGFSKKDRIALKMIREAQARGDLKPGQPVVELTSGNTGTGLAIVCGALGQPFIAVMSRGNTMERARMMAALGARVELVDQAPGSPPGQVSGDDLALVEQRAQALTRELGAFRADQFTFEANVLAHERHTGPEIWQQTKGRVDAFLDFVGTGGTLTGVLRHLKRQRADIRGYAVEPASAAVLAGSPVDNASHRIQGGGYAMARLPLLDASLIDGYLAVTDEQARAAARALAAEEGVFAGYSTGANLAAATDLLAGPERGRTLAILACDSGLKYLSTDLYEG